MKRISRCFICAAAAILPLAALRAPQQKGPSTLTLAAPKQPLKAGQPLILRATVTNTSGHDVHVWLSGGSAEVVRDYEVHVLDEEGRPAPPWVPPPQPEGRVLLRVGVGVGTELEPGRSTTDLVNVTDVYDLSRPGKYKVWVAERFGRGPGGLVRSNTITVTVVK
jgi:hypothetical protein